MFTLRLTEGRACAAEHGCKFIEVSTVLNYKLDELLVGIITQIRLMRRTTSMAAVSGCYGKARVVVDRWFGKRHLRRNRSCDSLLSL